MKKKIVSNLTPFYQIPLVQGRQVHQSKHLEIVHLTLEPGGEMETHTMPMDVIFYVLEGSGTLFVSDNPYHLSVNECIEVPKEASRYWSNKSVSPLKVLVIKLG